MQYLNILYFLIISWYGVKFLRSDGKVLKGALNPELSFQYSGPELFWILTFSTSLLAFSLDVGLDLMAIRLLVLELLCLWGMSIARNRAVMTLPVKLYFVFIAWLVIGLFYSPFPPMGVRTILKYLYPLLICLFASAAVRDSEVFFKSSKMARIVAAVIVIYGFIPYVGRLFPGVVWYGTARAINFISMMVLSVGLFFFTNKKKKNFLYALLFLAPCFIWVFRTSILGSGVAMMAFSLIKYRLKAVPIILSIALLGVIIAFTVPSIKEKMFYDDSVTIEDFQQGKISEDNFNTNSRSMMWEDLEKRFYNGKELAGSGTGTVQTWMYTNSEIYSGLMVPHSDFVQQKCDNGLIGLLLYGAMILLIFADCIRTYWSHHDQAIRLCAIVAGASMVGVYATLYSDNVVNYSMTTLGMPFGFYGMMLGMRRQKELDS